MCLNLGLTTSVNWCYVCLRCMVYARSFSVRIDDLWMEIIELTEQDNLARWGGKYNCTKLAADAYKRAGSPFVTTTKYVAGVHEFKLMYPYQLKESAFMKLNNFTNLGQY